MAIFVFLAYLILRSYQTLWLGDISMSYVKVKAEGEPKNVSLEFSLSLLSPQLNAWNLSYGYIQVELVNSNFSASGHSTINRT